MTEAKPDPVTRKEDLHIRHQGGVSEDPVVQVADRRTGVVLVQLAPQAAVTVGQALTMAAVQATDLHTQARAADEQQGVTT